MKNLFMLIIGSLVLISTGCSKSEKPRNFKLVVGAITGLDIVGGAVLKLVNSTTGENLVLELQTPPYIATIANGTWDIYLVGFTGPTLWQGIPYCGGKIAQVFNGADTDVTINANQGNCSSPPYIGLISKVTPVNNLGAWQFTKQLGETSTLTKGTALTTDTSGNIFVAGSTEGNLVTCNGVSANCTGSAQGGTDYFISKYNSSGTWVWTQQLGEAVKYTTVNGLVIDTSGNVYVMGQTNGNLVSCGGVSSSCSGLSRGTNDYFISKYNSSGNWQWSKQMGETAKDTTPSGLAIDSNDNLYVSGQTAGNLVSCNGVSANCSGSSQGSTDYFISKYNSLGAWQWSKQLGETAKTTSSGGVAIDSNGYVYISGNTTGNLVSCSGASASCSGSSQGTNDYFISKYDSSGAWVWTKQMGETAKSTGNAGIAIDKSNNIFITGATAGNLVSCNGVSANCSGSSQGTGDYYVSKYNSSGTWLWTQQLGQTAKIAFYCSGIAVDTSGSVFVSGETNGNFASCGGVSANCTGTSHGTGDHYLSKYNSSGAWQWSKQMGGGGETAGTVLSADTSGNLFITGFTEDNLPSCSGGSANCVGLGQGSNDYFISKYK